MTTHQKSSAQTPPRTSPLPALRGHRYTYRLVADPNPNHDALRLDLGFGIHLTRPLTGLKDPQPGQHVRSTATRLEPAAERAAAYYSYKAHLVRVIDGDTLWLDIDCGFEVHIQQKVRLRGIDAPELPTPEGERTRSFVKAALTPLPFLLVTTTKPDKYDRYLTDVFYQAGEDDPDAVLRTGTFLNRQLVSEGLAERFRD